MISTLESSDLISSAYALRFLIFLLDFYRNTLPLRLFVPPIPMASSFNDPQKTRISRHPAKGRRDKDIESSTSISSYAKELPLRTSLVRDSVKRRIFAYMDKGDRSADIEIKSSLSHLRVKHYRRMWKDERHDPRLRSKKRSRRKARRQVPSYEPVQLPLRLKSACGQKPELFQVAKSVAERAKRKHRTARGPKEREAKPRREDTGSEVQETSGIPMKSSDYPHNTETNP